MSIEVNHPSMGLKSTTPSAYQRHDTNENDPDSSMRQDRSNNKSMNQRYVEEQDMPEYIQMLEEHQAMCEREGRYVEAEIAKNRVSELRNQLEGSKKEELKERHMLERQQLEEDHMAEMAEFNDFWDKKMEEFNQQAALIEDQMLMRHQEEMVKFTEELNLSIPTKPKDSGELLNMRRIQQTLAKQKDYIEAHKVQQRCMKLEREEMEKWQVVRDQKIRNQRIQLDHKHNNEINAIRKRISTGQEEQSKARALDLERFLHKYQNMRKELTVRQQAEIMQVTKANKSTTGGSVYGSTYRSQSSKSNQSMTNGSMYKSNSKQGEAFKRQPLQDSSNRNNNKAPTGRPLQEKMKKHM